MLKGRSKNGSLNRSSSLVRLTRTQRRATRKAEAEVSIADKLTVRPCPPPQLDCVTLSICRIGGRSRALARIRGHDDPSRLRKSIPCACHFLRPTAILLRRILLTA
jgi:hypothetical protein